MNVACWTNYFHLCCLSFRIWEHLSSHRRRADLLYNLCSAGDSSVWILIGWCRGPVGDDFWERHCQSGEDDCGEMLCLHKLVFVCESLAPFCVFTCEQWAVSIWHIWQLNYPGSTKAAVKPYHWRCVKVIAKLNATVEDSRSKVQELLLPQTSAVNT